jgi:hypothetical protein
MIEESRAFTFLEFVGDRIITFDDEAFARGFFPAVVSIHSFLFLFTFIITMNSVSVVQYFVYE